MEKGYNPLDNIDVTQEMKYKIEENIDALIKLGYSRNLPIGKLNSLILDLEKMDVNAQLDRMRFLISYTPADPINSNFERFKQKLSEDDK